MSVFVIYGIYPTCQSSSHFKMILSPSLFLHSVIMFDLYLTNFYNVAPPVLAADWPPTALLVFHLNSCRWPFLKWESFFFFTKADKTIIALQGTCCMALTCAEPDKIDL